MNVNSHRCWHQDLAKVVSRTVTDFPLTALVNGYVTAPTFGQGPVYECSRQAAGTSTGAPVAIYGKP